MSTLGGRSGEAFDVLISKSITSSSRSLAGPWMLSRNYTFISSKDTRSLSSQTPSSSFPIIANFFVPSNQSVVAARS